MGAAMSLARSAKTHLKVYWQIDPEMNTKFADLFEPIPEVKVVDTTCGNYWQRAIFHRFNFLMNRAPAWPIRSDAVACAKGFRPWSVSTCSEFYANPDYGWIRPRAGIAREIEGEWSRMTVSDTEDGIIGVHIRRTDNAKAIEFSPIELFVSRMEQELVRSPKARFFVATDDCPTKELLKRHFGEHIITREQVAERDAQNGVQDALIDLMLLSRCSRIFGSYWSSFSGVAAMIGGCPLEIMKVGYSREDVTSDGMKTL